MVNGSEIKKQGTLPLKISKEVVSHLSRGLYRNFARAVKELISNSYDAGATEVKIKLDLDEGKVIVRDNGRGMDIGGVREKFLTIGFPTPLTEEVDELGRRRIGTFGIGCLSVFPYCKSMQIITKKRNSNDIIELNINTEQFFGAETFLMEKAKIPYKIYESDIPKKRGESIIILHDVKPHIIEELHREPIGMSSIDKFGGYEKFKWTLSQYAPIQFPPGRRDLRKFFDIPNRVPMSLWLDGEELFRNVPEDARILEKGEEQFGEVVIKYMIMSPMKPTEPEEARGLQVRLRDVAVGLTTNFDVIRLTGKVLGKLNYISGEIQILSGLDLAVMVDRDSFSYTQQVADIHEFFRKKLIKLNGTLEKWASEDKEIYETLQDLKQSEEVIDELKKKNIIHFSRERLRFIKTPITQKKEKELSSPSERLRKVLSRKDYKVIPKRVCPVSIRSPIQVLPKENKIIIYEQHPDLVETIEVSGSKFGVEYDEWEPTRTIYSICKLLDDENKVVFNTRHPLFRSKLHEDIVKRLSVGILLILKDRTDVKQLLKKVNRLLEHIFLG